VDATDGEYFPRARWIAGFDSDDGTAFDRPAQDDCPADWVDRSCVRAVRWPEQRGSRQSCARVDLAAGHGRRTRQEEHHDGDQPSSSEACGCHGES